MGFRANVQRAGARTTKYSGTANVSARKIPLGKASITRAGEVVIKQGLQTTYIPPATFKTGKAAYEKYERIKSVSGDSAASQMAKEVAKGNLALKQISPAISYAKSREASRQYRLNRQAGIQTIASITRAGEVVIKQGLQTTYIPPATFKTGKAAYEKYERIKSVSGDSAASQMAKEVAKGNLALKQISPASGGIETPVAMGGEQQAVQVLQPTTSEVVRQRSSSPIFSSNITAGQGGAGEPFSQEFLASIGYEGAVPKRKPFYLARPEALGGQPLPEGDKALFPTLYGEWLIKGLSYPFEKTKYGRFTEERQAGFIQEKGEAEAQSIAEKYQTQVSLEEKKAEEVSKMAEERAKVNLYNIDRNLREQNERIDKLTEEKSQAVISEYTSLKNLKSGKLSKAEAEAQLKAIWKESRAATGKLILSGQEKQEAIISKYEKGMQLYGEQWLPARQERLQQGYEKEIEEMSKKYQPYVTEKKIREGTALGKFGETIKLPSREVSVEKVNPAYELIKKEVRAQHEAGFGTIALSQYARPIVTSLDPIAVVSFRNPYTTVGYLAGRTIITGGREWKEYGKSFLREPVKTIILTAGTMIMYAGISSILGKTTAGIKTSAKNIKGWTIKNFFTEMKLKEGRVVERTPPAYLKLPKSYAYVGGRGKLPKLAVQELPKGFRLSEAGKLVKAGRGKLPSSGNAILYSQKVVAPSGSTLRSFVGWKTTGKILYAKSIGKMKPAITSVERNIPIKIRITEPSITGYKIIRTPSGKATIPIRTKSAFIELKHTPKEFDLRTWATPKQTFMQKFGISIKKLPAKTHEFWIKDQGFEMFKSGKYTTPAWVSGESMTMKIPADFRYLLNPKYSKALITGKEPIITFKYIKGQPSKVIDTFRGGFRIKYKKTSPYQEYLNTKYVVFDMSKLGRQIKIKTFKIADYVQAEGSIIKWFATKGLKNLGKESLGKTKILAGKTRGLAARIYARSPVKVRIVEPRWVKGIWGKVEEVKQPFFKYTKTEASPMGSIKWIKTAGKTKKITLFKVNIGKKLYESAIFRKGRRFQKLYGVAKEQAGILPKQEWKLSSWLKSSERERILKSWAKRKPTKGELTMFTAENKIEGWKFRLGKSKYAGGGVESNVHWENVPDILTGKKGTGFLKVPVVQPHIAVNTAALGGLIWSHKGLVGSQFKPESLSKFQLKYASLNAQDIGLRIGERQEHVQEIIPITIPRQGGISITAQELQIRTEQIPDIMLKPPRFPRGIERYGGRKPAIVPFKGFEFKRRKKYKPESFYYFERTHKIMSPQALMKMMFGGKMNRRKLK